MGKHGQITTPSKSTAKRSSAAAAASVSPSPRKSARSSVTVTATASSSLNPSLPRLPSLPGGASSPSTSSLSKMRASPSKTRLFRQRGTSDDPSTCNSDNDEDEQDVTVDREDLFEQSMMSTASAAAAAARPRSRSTVAGRPSASAITTTAVNNTDSQNICVCVRVRPPAPGSLEDAAPIWDLDQISGRISLTENHPTMEKRKGASSEDVYNYRFDSLLQAPDVTEKLYAERISSIVEAAMEGFNATVFSYGQTGSGKTHTMMGNVEEPGIIPQAIKDIFDYIESDPSREFLLRISYLEIYNESLRDLLAKNQGNGSAANKSKELILREEKGRIVVQNLKEEIVKDAQEIFRYLDQGEDQRSVAGTDFNARSSRSHCVFSMIIESRPKATLPTSDSTELPYAASSSSLAGPLQQPPKGEVRVSQLNLIDLAGSEKATSQEQRRKEGAYINKSLLSLGTVMQKLADPKTSGGHIPFRDSKLTRLLQTSLSGNARIAVICTISPEAQHGDESLSTLKFASRAMKIVTKAERGVVIDGATGLMIAKYEAQVQDLERRLLEAEALQTAANQNRLGTPRPESRAGAEEELDEERQKRAEAETAAEERRLQIIIMEQEITRLQSQIISAPPAQPMENGDLSFGGGRHYGDIGNGDGPARPAGPRGKRRISDMVFGMGTPLSRIRGQHGSFRNFTSALEMVKSPSMASLAAAATGPSESERVQELEKEVEMLKAALAANGSDRRDHQADLQAQIQEMETRLAGAAEQLELAIVERDGHRQRDADQAEQIIKLQQELETLTLQNSESSFKQHEGLAALRSELDDLRQQASLKDSRISELEQQLVQTNAERDSELTQLSAELKETKEQLESTSKDKQKTERTIVDLQSQLKEADEAFNKLEASQGQSAIVARGKLENAEKRGSEAEKRFSELQERMENERRFASQEQKRLTEEHEAILAGMQKQLDQQKQDHTSQLEHLHTSAEVQAAEALSQQKQLNKQLSDLSSDLAKSRQFSSEQSKLIASLKEELEKKAATKAAIAAANAPPDFSSLHAKLAAVSGKSSSAARSAGLGNSLGSSTSSRRSDNDGLQIESLKLALEHAKREHVQAKEIIVEQESEIEALNAQLGDAKRELEANEVEMTSLKKDVRKFRGDIDNMVGLFESFRDTLCTECAENMPLSKRDPTPSSPASSAPPKAVVERPPPPRSPFGALSGYSQQQKPPSSHVKSASVNYGSYLKSCSRPGTPIRGEGKYGYTGLHGTPEPLPIPSEWSAQRKKDVRRASLAKELDGLVAAKRTMTSKTALMSPMREEKRSNSEYTLPGSPSRRSAKSSAESQLWYR